MSYGCDFRFELVRWLEPGDPMVRRGFSGGEVLEMRLFSDAWPETLFRSASEYDFLCLLPRAEPFAMQQLQGFVLLPASQSLSEPITESLPALERHRLV